MRKYILLFPLIINGCISSQQVEHAHEVLDVITDVAQPLYDMLPLYCHTKQLGIVRDPEISNVQKRAKIAKVLSFCNSTQDAFEAAIEAQKAARDLLELGEAVAAMAKINEVREHILNGEQAFARMREKIDP